MTELHDLETLGPDFSKLNGREALQSLVDLHDTTQFEVNDDDDDDPVLLTLPERNVVDTWREDYPYEERMSRREYEVTKRRLQIELLKLQKWSKQTGQRHLLVFEGRDAAGKGGTIKRFNEHLNPRAPGSSRWRSPRNASPPSGTSSGTCSICPRAARWSSSTAPGTTVPASSV